MTAVVEINCVTKEYLLGRVAVPALRDVSLRIEEGEFTAIAGPSGSGKTTLLNLIGCVDVPTRGDVRIAGQSTGALSSQALTELRLHKLGFVFQGFNLIGVLTVFENVELPLLLQGKLSAKARQQRVVRMLEHVGLRERASHRPSELSGGQRQRVAIARALVTAPQLVLADEPTANLDSTTGQSIIDLMQQLNKTEGTTFIFSTHDPRVMTQATRLLEMRDGSIVDADAPREADSSPASARG